MTHHYFWNAVSLIGASLFAWFAMSMLLDNSAPIAVADLPGVANAAPVPRNGSLRIKYTVTVDRACVGDGQRVFTDAGGTQQPATPFSITSGIRSDGTPVHLGETFDDQINVTVPNGAAPGPATYQNHTVFYCNFWQRLFHSGIVFDYPLVNFTIGNETLPTVQPSTSIFRRRSSISGSFVWLRRHVWWPQGDEP